MTACRESENSSDWAARSSKLLARFRSRKCSTSHKGRTRIDDWPGVTSSARSSCASVDLSSIDALPGLCIEHKRSPEEAIMIEALTRYWCVPVVRGLEVTI